MSRNSHMELNKITLTGWVDQILEKSFTNKNIKSGFRATFIWPFNPKGNG